MKKTNLKNNIFLVAKKSETKCRKLDYYLQFPNGEEEYAFTKDFSSSCYDACKSGMPINKILFAKKNNTAYMKLVKYLNFMMPFFMEYFDLNSYICSDESCCKYA